MGIQFRTCNATQQQTVFDRWEPDRFHLFYFQPSYTMHLKISLSSSLAPVSCSRSQFEMTARAENDSSINENRPEFLPERIKISAPQLIKPVWFAERSVERE